MEQDQENLDMSWKCENEEIYEWEDEERNIIRRNGNGDRGRLGRSTDLGYSTQGEFYIMSFPLFIYIPLTDYSFFFIFF